MARRVCGLSVPPRRLGHRVEHVPGRPGGSTHAAAPSVQRVWVSVREGVEVWGGRMMVLLTGSAVGLCN